MTLWKNRKTMERHLQTLLHSVVLALVLWVGYTVNNHSILLATLQAEVAGMKLLLSEWKLTTERQLIDHERRIDLLERNIDKLEERVNNSNGN